MQTQFPVSYKFNAPDQLKSEVEKARTFGTIEITERNISASSDGALRAGTIGSIQITKRKISASNE